MLSDCPRSWRRYCRKSSTRFCMAQCLAKLEDKIAVCVRAIFRWRSAAWFAASARRVCGETCLNSATSRLPISRSIQPTALCIKSCSSSSSNSASRSDIAEIILPDEIKRREDGDAPAPENFRAGHPEEDFSRTLFQMPANDARRGTIHQVPVVDARQIFPDRAGKSRCARIRRRVHRRPSKAAAPAAVPREWAIAAIGRRRAAATPETRARACAKRERGCR